MARPCPACGRPNGDRAPKCLYCSAVLPVLGVGPHPHDSWAQGCPEPEPTDRSEPVATEAPPSRRHLIILAPIEGPPDGKVDSLAQAAALSSYEARLLLAGRRFRVLKKVESGADAEALSRKLREAGIPHVTVSEADLEAVPLRKIRGGGLDPETLTLRLENRETVAVPYEDLLLVVKGEITRERFEEKRLGTNRRASLRLTPAHRLHIYCYTSGAFDLDPEEFDWAILGKEQTSSLFLNLQKLVAEMVKRAPSLAIDEKFRSETAVLTRKEVGDGTTLLLENDARQRQTLLYDNEPQFRYFSRWRYLVAQTYPSNTYTSG